MIDFDLGPPPGARPRPPPEPAPVSPPPAPAVTPPARGCRPAVAGWLLPTALLVMTGVVAYDHALPTASDPYFAAGKAYARALGPCFAAGANAYAASVEAGKSLDDATAAEAAAFKAARVRAFEKTVQAAVSPLVTEGGEPADRAGYARAWRSVARGAE